MAYTGHLLEVSDLPLTAQELHEKLVEYTHDNGAGTLSGTKAFVLEYFNAKSEDYDNLEYMDLIQTRAGYIVVFPY